MTVTITTEEDSGNRYAYISVMVSDDVAVTATYGNVAGYHLPVFTNGIVEHKANPEGYSCNIFGNCWTRDLVRYHGHEKPDAYDMANELTSSMQKSGILIPDTLDFQRLVDLFSWLIGGDK